MEIQQRKRGSQGRDVKYEEGCIKKDMHGVGGKRRKSWLHMQYTGLCHCGPKPVVDAAD